MSPLVAALLGLLAGLLAGAAVVATIAGRRGPDAPAPVTLHEDLQPVLDSLRAAVAVVGPHDELVAANDPARRLGLVGGTRVAIPAVLDLVRAVRRSGEAEVANVDRTAGPGRPALQLALRVLPLVDERVFVVADDRAQLLRAHETTRDFMTNVTHELKTPIGAISLLSETLEDAAADPEAVVRFARQIHTESIRLADLVGQILALSRLQGHPGRATAEPVPVDDLIADALHRCRTLASGRRVSLTASGASGLWVRGDADQLATALVNLVQNAVNYSEPGARVVLTSRAASGGQVEIAVSDNGIGIAPADQERIFERFYRVDAARSRETGGTGLGLSMVREIAEGHGGSVTVWSQPGAGSTFTLRLPEADPDAEASGQEGEYA